MHRAIHKLAGTVLGLSLVFGNLPSVGATLQKGDILPSFEVKSTSGEVISQKSFDGKIPGVIYLYKTQKCNPCTDGLEQLKEVNNTLTKDVKIVAISKDEAGQGLTFSSAIGDNAIFDAFSAQLLPTTLLVGPDGKVVKVIQGGKQVGDILNALAENQLQQKHTGNAQKLYFKASKSGISVVAQAGMAYTQLKDGKTGEAEQSFKELASSPDKQLAIQGKEGLAELYFQQGKTDDALKTAEEVLKEDPNRTMANLVKGKTLFAKGQAGEAEKTLTMAAADTTNSDFAWQKAEANLALGNMQMQGKNSQIALKSFKKASGENPYYAEALSNEGSALKDMGEPEKAMEVFQKLQKIDPTDKLVHSLLRQAQEAIAQKQDLEKQHYIDGMVKDLLKQAKEQKKAGPSADEWTSPAIAISILGFQNNAGGGTLMGRVGLEGILQDELLQALQAANIKVVDRAIIDKLLAELKLGSSELADPDTALKLGRILAARLIATGSFNATPSGATVTMRLVDTETTDIVLSLSEKDPKSDPTEIAPKFAKAIQKTLSDKFPLKGRIANVDGDTIIINLGKKHGVQSGALFNVVGDGKPIELNGKIIGYKPAQLGNLEITKVEDLMAYAKVVKKSGDWTKNQKIIQQQSN